MRTCVRYVLVCVCAGVCVCVCVRVRLRACAFKGLKTPFLLVSFLPKSLLASKLFVPLRGGLGGFPNLSPFMQKLIVMRALRGPCNLIKLLRHTKRGSK